MGFYAKDEPAHPAPERAVARALSRAQKPWPENAWPPIFTVGIGHRFYNPSLGRWMSRDPVSEKGAQGMGVGFTPLASPRATALAERDLYVFCANAGTGVVDPDGLFIFPIVAVPPEKPDFCCDCTTKRVKPWIEQQKGVVDQLQQIIDDDDDIVLFDPSIVRIGALGGYRGPDYHKMPRCAQVCIDEIESAGGHGVADVLRAFILQEKWARIEQRRSLRAIRCMERMLRDCRDSNWAPPSRG